MAKLCCICKVKCDTSFINCSGPCDGLFHEKCVKIRHAYADGVKKMKNILWCCDNCLSDVLNNMKITTKLIEITPPVSSKEDFSYKWIPSSINEKLPANAVTAGRDIDDIPIYVGRTVHLGDQLTVKIIGDNHYASVCYGGYEIPKEKYEILCGIGFSWVASANGHAPEGAVSTGKNSDGESLFIGRAHHNHNITPGKIHQSHHCLYIPYRKLEHKFSEYEVLVSSGEEDKPSGVDSTISKDIRDHPNRHKNTSHFEKTFFAVSIGTSNTTCQKSKWTLSSAYESLPNGAVLGGYDVDADAPIYIGRAYHKDRRLPAMILPDKDSGRQVAYVSFNGHEIPKYLYEVLCNENVSWVPSMDGSIPAGAVVEGLTDKGERIYIGRIRCANSSISERIQQSDGRLLIFFGGSPILFKDFEVLVENKM